MLIELTIKTAKKHLTCKHPFSVGSKRAPFSGKKINKTDFFFWRTLIAVLRAITAAGGGGVQFHLSAFC